MHVILCAASKGGVGKSSIVMALATRTLDDGHRAAVIDLNDDQSSLHALWRARAQHEGMNAVAEFVAHVGGYNLAKTLSVLRKDCVEWVFIDSPPSGLDLIELAIMHADLVIIPLKMSLLDDLAVRDIAVVCRTRRKPFCYLLTMTIHHKSGHWRRMLEAEGGRVFKTEIKSRVAWPNAAPFGKSPAEIDSAVAEEIDGLWAEIREIREAHHG
jgi:chromosome partitioning protein